jgi:hypothetical protein
MQGRRSQNLVIPYNPEIERTIRQPRRPKEDSEEERNSKLEKIHRESTRRPMKSSFIPQNLNQPSCIAYQPNAQGSFNLSPHLLNMLPHFRGTPSEDPYLHIRDFFDLCKTQNIHGLTPEAYQVNSLSFFIKR